MPVCLKSFCGHPPTLLIQLGRLLLEQQIGPGDGSLEGGPASRGGDQAAARVQQCRPGPDRLCDDVWG